MHPEDVSVFRDDDLVRTCTARLVVRHRQGGVPGAFTSGVAVFDSGNDVPPLLAVQAKLTPFVGDEPDSCTAGPFKQVISMEGPASAPGRPVLLMLVGR